MGSWFLCLVEEELCAPSAVRPVVERSSGAGREPLSEPEDGHELVVVLPGRDEIRNADPDVVDESGSGHGHVGASWTLEILGSARRVGSRMVLRIGSIVLRVDDLQRQREFWEAALGYVRRDDGESDDFVLLGPLMEWGRTSPSTGSVRRADTSASAPRSVHRGPEPGGRALARHSARPRSTGTSDRRTRTT